VQIDHDTVLTGVIALAAKNTDIEVVWLYGSRATGDYHDASDFDLAIAFKNFTLSPSDKLSRPHELAMDWALALDVPTDIISIVDVNLVPAYLGFNVVEYGCVIFQESTARPYNEANRIYSQYEFQMIESKYDES
jgi:predicted nucleotidyltransferase